MNQSNESILVVDDNVRKNYCVMPNTTSRVFLVSITNETKGGL